MLSRLWKSHLVEYHVTLDKMDISICYHYKKLHVKRSKIRKYSMLTFTQVGVTNTFVNYQVNKSITLSSRREEVCRR